MASSTENYEPLITNVEEEECSRLCNMVINDLSSERVEEILERRIRITVVEWLKLIAWESKVVWYLSGASIIVSAFCFMFTTVTLIFVGHLGSLPLAGASIATIGIQGLAFGIMIGMASAVQTYCGQTYGAKRYDVMGIIFQKALILQLGAAIILSFLYWYCGPILKAMGQIEEIAQEGQTFAHGLIPQLYAFALSFPMQRFLQAQNIVNPLAYMVIGVFCLHILLSWVVIYVLGYGLFEAALTLSFSWWVFVIINGLYIVLSPSCKQSWTGFSRRAFIGLWPYFMMTVASAVMLCLEIWYSRALILLSGLLPTNPTISLDSISICMNYWIWDMSFMLGLCSATSVRVSNELGAGHPKVARFSVIVVNGTSLLISIIFSTLILIFRVSLSKLFTTDSKVIEAVSHLIPLLAISVLLNGIQPILSGVAIGSGWQSLVAYVNLAAYYLVGLPIGCVLAFKTSLGVAGMWWGMIAGILLQTMILIILTMRTDWDKEVVKAIARVNSEDAKLDLVDNF